MATKAINEMTIDEYRAHCEAVTRRKSTAFDLVYNHIQGGGLPVIHCDKPTGFSECASAYGVAGKQEAAIILPKRTKTDFHHFGHVVYSDGVVMMDVGIDIGENRLSVY